MKPFLLIWTVLFNAFSLGAQNVKYIQLKQERITYVPNGFYISDVVDDREDKGSIGEINTGGKTQSIDLHNGVATSLKAFIANNVKQDRTSQPVTLHIKELYADVNKRGTQWNAVAKAGIAFYVGDTKVVELTGNGHGVMATDPGDYYESFIRRTIESDLKRFDDWWAQNKGSIVTRSSVKVNVSIARTTDKPDCIVYFLNRPLQVSDFQGPVEGQTYEMAITASGIGISYSEQTQNGQIVIDLTIAPYFNRAKSWFKKEARSANVLAHEQAHFDITAIKACELAGAIRNTSFNRENYKQLLEQLQQQNGRESTEEEAAYDKDTNHGIIADKQMEWQKKISAQVRTIGCY